MGLPTPGPDASCLIEGYDTRPTAVSRIDNAAGLTVLVGEIEDPGELARSLSLPVDASPAAMAQAALAAHGPQMPAHLMGEYSCLSVDRTGSVTLVQSAAQRDPLLYALGNGGFAVSPSVFALARLPWVGRELDPMGLATFLGRARTRLLRDNRTILRNVFEVLPGETVNVAPGGQVTRSMADLFAPAARFAGTRSDALEAVEDLLMRMLAARMARHEQPAVLLSGGIDSSLLALFMARARGHGRGIGAITSVAPPGSGLADEQAEAALVAQALQFDHRLCWPKPEANPFVPRPELFKGRNGPLTSNRHALTDALQEAGRAFGATLLVNGTYGEGSVTVRADGTVAAITLGTRLRLLARQVRDQFVPRAQPGIGFHARLAPDLIASLPVNFAAPPDPPDALADEDGLFGYKMTALKGLSLPTEYAPGAIRMDFPFRDLRLLRLFASLPRDYLRSAGGDREFARQLMAGRLPEAIHQRQQGRPASPDHLLRLRGFAQQTREMIGPWRAAGAGDWIDLAWLDRALTQMSRQPPGHTLASTEVQITAMAAAFFAWWAERDTPHGF